MKPVVLFGNGRVARLAHFYLTHDSEQEVVAFTVERDYVRDDTLLELPVVPADEVLFRFPPDRFDMKATPPRSKLGLAGDDRPERVIRAGMASPPLEHERDSLPQPSDRVGAPLNSTLPLVRRGPVGMLICVRSPDDGAGPTSMTGEAPRAPTAAVERPML
jgi:hypothetical protein